MECLEQTLQTPPAATVKPGLPTQYVLILAGASNFKADSFAGWSEAHSQLSSFPQCDFVHYNFDERLKILVILDLIDRVRVRFFCAILLLPPAASWSRARHTGPGQWPLRSWSSPLGLQGVSANDYDRLQHSNKAGRTNSNPWASPTAPALS